MTGSRDILDVLDKCCEAFTFPMLDNGYVYLAASRLSLHRSVEDWAMVIEIFGFSPRAGSPDTFIHTFASKLRDRDPPEKFASRQAYDNHLARNPHNQMQAVFPIDDGDWQDADDRDFVSQYATHARVRGREIAIPTRAECELHGIVLVEPPRLRTFELCRYLSAVAREGVLATPAERRINVFSEMKQILQLEQWNHPDIVESQLPSGSETFQQLARVLETGDTTLYDPSLPANTHWRNWPEGGTL
jgi:hypothetical protein